MQINIMSLEVFKSLSPAEREKQLKIYNMQQNYMNQIYGEGSSTVYDDAKKLHKELK
ncbi:MAG: hypothetical protein ACRCXT_10120 [Paraclostridium sp.]